MNNIDYNQINLKYPWILEESSPCIISPDTDGILCAILTKKNVVGFFDGKTMLISPSIDYHICDFLDIEICEENVKSIGNHYTSFTETFIYETEKYMKHSLNIGRIGGVKEFKEKYPFGTSHFLYLLKNHIYKKNNILTIDECIPFFHADGTWETSSKYAENCSIWKNCLNWDGEYSPFSKMFSYPHEDIIKKLDNFRRERDKHDICGWHTGDKILLNEKVLKRTDSNTVVFKSEYIEDRLIWVKYLCDSSNLEFNEKLWEEIFNNKYVIRDYTQRTIKRSIKNINNMLIQPLFSFAQLETNKINYSINEYENKQIVPSLF